MKFKLRIAKNFYEEKDEVLEELGFEFKEYNLLGPYNYEAGRFWKEDENPPVVEVDSLEELMELRERVDCGLLVDEDEIIIYNG